MGTMLLSADHIKGLTGALWRFEQSVWLQDQENYEFLWEPKYSEVKYEAICEVLVHLGLTKEKKKKRGYDTEN